MDVNHIQLIYAPLVHTHSFHVVMLVHAPMFKHVLRIAVVHDHGSRPRVYLMVIPRLIRLDHVDHVAHLSNNLNQVHHQDHVVVDAHTKHVDHVLYWNSVAIALHHHHGYHNSNHHCSMNYHHVHQAMVTASHHRPYGMPSLSLLHRPTMVDLVRILYDVNAHHHNMDGIAIKYSLLFHVVLVHHHWVDPLDHNYVVLPPTLHMDRNHCHPCPMLSLSPMKL